MNHKISPVLIGSDGSSKKITIPFLEPVAANQPFAVLLKCTLPGCIKTGVEYYTSTLSFDQDTVTCCTVRLKFIGDLPEWMRVYEISGSGNANLLKKMMPGRQTSQSIQYADLAEEVRAKSTRIYVFRRPTDVRRQKQKLHNPASRKRSHYKCRSLAFHSAQTLGSADQSVVRNGHYGPTDPSDGRCRTRLFPKVVMRGGVPLR